VNTAKRIVVASFSFCVSLVSDEEALNWIDQREKSIRSVQQAGAKDEDRVKQESSRALKMAKLKRAEYKPKPTGKACMTHDERTLRMLTMIDEYTR